MRGEVRWKKSTTEHSECETRDAEPEKLECFGEKVKGCREEEERSVKTQPGVFAIS